MFKRYAVFFTMPPETPLARFGLAWLGWDSAAGQEIAQIEGAADVTQAPQKYGFHGTIKAPFRLGDGLTEDALREGFETMCAGLAAAALPGLHLSKLGRFFALVPDGDVAPLRGLAGQVVQQLDHFRAPLNAAEIARRTPDRLTPQQRAHLDQWGYPFVMEQFRFHMTLTDRLNKETSAGVETVLKALLEDLKFPTQIDHLTLMGEAENGRFHQIKRAALGQSTR